MYTSKSFYEFFPGFLPSDVQSRVDSLILVEKEMHKNIEDLLLKYSQKQKLKEVEGVDLDDSHFMNFPADEVDSVYEKFKYKEICKGKNSISSKYIAGFISKMDKFKFDSAKDVFMGYVKTQMAVYDWFKASEEHKYQLAREGKNPYDCKFVSNYWHFMEFQSDLSTFGFVLFALMTDEEKKSIDFKDDTLRAVTSLKHTGGMKSLAGLSQKEALSNLLKITETAMSWAYDENDKWIVKNVYKGSSQKDFEESVDFLIALYAFVQKINWKSKNIKELCSPEYDELQSNHFANVLLFNNISANIKIKEINDLEDFAVELDKTIHMLSDWICKTKNLVVASKYDISDVIKTIPYHVVGKSRALYKLGVALVLLYQTQPSLNYFKSLDKFNTALSVVSKNGNPVELYPYNLTFFNVLRENFVNLTDILLSNESDTMSEDGKAVFIKSAMLEKFGLFMKESGLDVGVLSEAGYPAKSNADIDFMSKFLIITDDVNSYAGINGNWQKIRKEKEEKLFARLHKMWLEEKNK